MSFETAYKQTKKFEGGYVNDPVDRGGETFRGISRNNHPGWPGWPFIDGAKAEAWSLGCSSPNALAGFIDSRFQGDAVMDKLVRDFYKANFWDPFDKLGDARGRDLK